MEDRSNIDAGIAMVGDALGPLYLKDPAHDRAIRDSYAALFKLDVPAASAEWPFVPDGEASACLQAMKDSSFCGEVPPDDLLWEYRHLFVGPDPMPAPPYGSVYTDHDKVLFGESTLELRQWMRQRGIERIGGSESPEDNIGELLVLIAWLARNKPESVEELLCLHVLPWSSHFLEELEQSANYPFYRGLARLTRLSLEGMRDALCIEVVYPHFYR